MLRRGHRKHRRTNLTAVIRVGNEAVQCDAQVAHYLAVRMHAHHTFKEHPNQRMKIAREAEARL